MMDLYLIIGSFAALLVLAAYIQASRGKWKATSLRFQLFNAVGASLLMFYGLHIGAYPNVALNAVWLAVAMAAILRTRRT